MNNAQRDLIVGELIGKVDPADMEGLIRHNYFPIYSNNIRIELSQEASSEREIIFRVLYPNSEISGGHPARIIFKFFESEQNLIAGIITEQVDFAITESDETAEEIEKSTSAVQVLFRRKPPNLVKQIVFNNQHPILRNKNIRRALTYAIDRNYIYTRILRQVADLADGPYARESKFHISGLDEYKYNPRKAMQLMEAENWIDANDDDVLDNDGMPFRISLTYEKGVLLEEQLATRIKIDWNKLGVDVVRNPVIKSEIEKMLTQKNYDALLMNYKFEETIESIESFFQSNGANNVSGYQNRKVDQYLHNYKLAVPATQNVLLQAILNEINQDSPAAFLFFLWLDRYFVNRNKVKNFQDPNGLLLPFTEWDFKE
ncbi:MAG: ABC transporter substrate-binding protein [bacterium]|nr:ABC transporter substrate-binding protein [bacterium]